MTRSPRTLFGLVLSSVICCGALGDGVDASAAPLQLLDADRAVAIAISTAQSADATSGPNPSMWAPFFRITDALAQTHATLDDEPSVARDSNAQAEATPANASPQEAAHGFLSIGEPSSVALTFAGLAALVWITRRRVPPKPRAKTEPAPATN